MKRQPRLLSNLARHLKTGLSGEYPFHSPDLITDPESACHYLGVSAKHCREAFSYLRLAGRTIWRFLKSQIKSHVLRNQTSVGSRQ